jgi:HEAT repeat protein
MLHGPVTGNCCCNFSHGSTAMKPSRTNVTSFAHSATSAAPRRKPSCLELLTTESGLILGDLANALGRLRLRAALPALKELKDHPLEWVRQNVAFAERRLEGE